MDIEDHMEYINRSFIEKIYKNKVPKVYKCSSCGEGALDFIDDTFHCFESNDSTLAQQHEDWEPEWIEQVFSGVLACRNCNQKFAVSGIGGAEEDYDEEYGKYICEYFYPKYFCPELHLFKIPINTPKKIHEIIISSFYLAWSDFSASGNKLRVALEIIVNDLAENVNEKDTLGNKIAKIPDKHLSIKNMINAIKWLGNQASHEARLKEYDLAFAYEVTDLVLNELYPDTVKKDSLLKHVGLVNKAKGSIAKS